MWATLIGLMVEGRVVVGVVSAPALGRRWWASAGAGAFTGKTLLQGNLPGVEVGSIDDASLSYSSVHGWVDSGRGQQFVDLMRGCWRTQAYGDFWSYMLVAEGAVDIASEPELALHDMAALDVIVREAGDGSPTWTAPTGWTARARSQPTGYCTTRWWTSWPSDRSASTQESVRILGIAARSALV